MQIKIHLISDLDYGWNEWSSEEDLELPDVDLIVLNGNIGRLKRSMLYAETIARKYPNTKVIYNLGWLEQYYMVIGKSDNEQIKNTENRFKLNPSVPKNLHFSLDSQIIKFNNGFELDVLTTFGFCEIHKLNTAWENTIWFKKCVSRIDFARGKIEGLPTDDVIHGQVPYFATPEWMHEQYIKEYDKVRNWENTVTCKKLLITSANPYQDKLYDNLEVSPYKIHLQNGLWLCSGSKVDLSNFLGARLVSNPGRGLEARQHIITLDLG